MKFATTILILLASLSGITQDLQMKWYGDTLPDFKYTLDSTYTSQKDFKEAINQTQSEAFSKGYLLFSIDSIKELDSIHFTAQVTTGPQFQWENTSLEIMGPDLPSYLVPNLNHSIVSSQNIFETYQQIISYYQNNGYPFASAQFDSLSIKENHLTGKLKIETNQKITFDTLSVRKSSQLKPYYLANYLGLRKGTLYDESKIKTIRQKIRELPFVTLKGKPTIDFKKNKAIVYLPLKHKSANFINGVIGVLPNSTSALNPDKSKLVITGDLKLSLGNIFHHGEKIKVNWKRLQTETQQLNASTEIPFLFKSLFGLSYELDLLKQDTTYINYKNKIGVVYTLGAKRNLKAFWENAGTNKLSDSPLSETNLTSINGGINAYGIEFLMDERDYKFNPRKGYLINIEAKAGIKKLTGVPTNGKISVPINTSGDVTSSLYVPQTSNVYQGKLTLEGFIPLFKITTIRLASKLGWIENNYLLDNDLTRLGGFTLLRGFDEQSVFASGYAVSTFEYRILFEQNSHLAFFYDQGIIQKSTLIEQEIDYPFGFGVGINFQTKPGIFSVSYAIGKQAGNPIDFSAAKIHFGFINLF